VSTAFSVVPGTALGDWFVCPALTYLTVLPQYTSLHKLMMEATNRKAFLPVLYLQKKLGQIDYLLESVKI
jgi:hypothetical protein